MTVSFRVADPDTMWAIIRTVIRDVARPMYIFRERDIERKAWEKHGGPEAFDA